MAKQSNICIAVGTTRFSGKHRLNLKTSISKMAAPLFQNSNSAELPSPASIQGVAYGVMEQLFDQNIEVCHRLLRF